MIPSERYSHFLLLHAAITILCDDKLCVSHLEVADAMLKEFVTSFGEIYGAFHKVYNVHSLVHISADVKYFENLNSNVSVKMYAEKTQYAVSSTF